MTRFHGLRGVRGTTNAFVYFQSITSKHYHIYKNILSKFTTVAAIKLQKIIPFSV